MCTKTLCGLISSFMVLVAQAIAEDLYVPTDFATISAAIDASKDGDTIHVFPGTYPGLINFQGKAIRLESTDGPDVTILDGEHQGTVVRFESGEGPDSVARGFTIKRGASKLGGGILCRSSSPTIQGNLVMECIVANFDEGVGKGAGIACVDGASPIIRGNTICRNDAQWTSASDYGQGAGIYAKDSSPIILENIFEWNIADSEFGASTGGGVSVHGGHVLMEGNLFTSNYSGWFGGAVHVESGEVIIRRCFFADNYASVIGGALFVAAGEVLVEDSVFFRNTGRYGGGIAVVGGSLDLRRCTFTENYARATGGAIRIQRSTSPPEVRMQGCVVYGNVADERYPEIEDILQYAEVSYTDVRGGWPGIGNIDADPLFVDPASDQVGLGAGSPCIDAGDPADRPTGLDLDGHPRLLDGDLDRAMVVDMGGLEHSNVHLEVSGLPSAGETLTFESTGRAGMFVFLFAGLPGQGALLPPYGSLRLDASTPYLMKPFAVLPDSRDLVVPPGIQAGTELMVQELAVEFFSRNGNFSNPVTLRFE